jgi:hypothetical protein
MPWQLVSVNRNVCSGVLLYGVSGIGEPNGATVIVGLLLQLPCVGDADALVAAAKLAPPTAIAAMAASPMVAGQRRRRCLPISRMLGSLREQVPPQIVSVNNAQVTP